MSAPERPWFAWECKPCRTSTGAYEQPTCHCGRTMRKLSDAARERAARDVERAREHGPDPDALHDAIAEGDFPGPRRFR